MPVRSSICTYSPSSVSNSRYNPSSSLSVGHYKPFSSSTLTTSKSYSPGSQITSNTRYSISSFSPSQLNSSSYSSISSTSSYTPSTGSYRPLSSTHNSFNSGRYGNNSQLPSGYSRYSSALSTGSASSSSISSSNSLLDRSDTLSGKYSKSCGSSYQPSIRSLRKSSFKESLYSSEPLPDGVPKGLNNLGNTCYMNSVLQSLYAIETFRKFILQAPHDKLLTADLSDLFKSMKNSSVPVSPSTFRYTFSGHQSRFSAPNQHDAQEFLRYLINGIHEEFNKASTRPRRSTPMRAPRSAAEAWLQYREIVDDSPLVDIVVGQLCSTIICSICQNKSYCWDPFWDLSLPLIRGRHTCRLSDVVQDFIAKETLDSDERPICSVCKRATRSTKQISVCRMPELMILHLKKFSNDGYKLTSPDVKIDHTLTFNGTSYKLTACISHHGHSSSSGHYTSHCEYASRWFHFNDDRVREVTDNFDSAKLSEAYVLFYTQSSVLDHSKL